MRTIEILLIISSISFLICYYLKLRKAAKWIFYFSLSTLILHFIIDNMRWQMVPEYISVFLIVLLFFNLLKIKWLKKITFVFILILIAISASLSILLPVVNFPEPTGEFNVGTKSIFLEDQTRLEGFTEESNDKRKIAIKIWYPSEEKIENPEKYLSGGFAEAFAASKGLPKFIFSHFRLTTTFSQENLSIVKKNKLPIIILSHGYLWNAELYSSIISELASQGFLIAGIEHSYEAPLVNWKDQKIYPIQTYFEKMNAKMDFDKWNKLQEEFKSSQNGSLSLNIMKEMMHMLPYTESVDRWAQDISFVIDELILRSENPGDFLYHKVDTSKIGLLGHSFGGGAVGQACAYDNRVKAGINMDGAQWGNLIDTTLNVPFMCMYADRDYDNFFTPNFLIYDHVCQNDYYEVTIKNSGHANFGDLGYWSSVHKLTETGTINPEKMTHFTTKLIIIFFRKYLNEKKIDIIQEFNNEYYHEIIIK